MKKFAAPLGLALVASLLALSCVQVDALSLGPKNQTLVKPVSSARHLGGYEHQQLAYAPVQHAGAYEAPPLQQQAYGQPSYAPIVQQQSYSLPIVQAYEQPGAQQAYPPAGYSPSTSYSPAANYSSQSYSAPLPVPQLPTYYQPAAYGQQPVYTNYSQQAHHPAAPLVQGSYSPAPYAAPLGPASYSAPSPGYGAHPEPAYQLQGYASAPAAYSPPAYAAPNYTSPSYGAHAPPSYGPIQTELYDQQQQLYQPVVQGHQQPAGGYLAVPQQLQQQHYQPAQVGPYAPALSSGVSWVLKRQLNETAPPVEGDNNSNINTSGNNKNSSATLSTPTIASSTDLAADTLLFTGDQTKSESSVGPTFALPPAGFAPANLVHRPPAIVPIQAPAKPALANLDIQPEFTQAWADFAQPPGYLPLAFKNIPLYHYHQSQYLKQQQGFYHNINSQLAQAIAQNIGFGYVTWSGPINPASFYTPVQPLYFYKIPPLSPFYQLNPGPKLALGAHQTPQQQQHYQPQQQQYQPQPLQQQQQQQVQLVHVQQKY